MCARVWSVWSVWSVGLSFCAWRVRFFLSFFSPFFPFFPFFFPLFSPFLFDLSEDIIPPSSSSLASCSSAIICFLANPQELLQQTPIAGYPKGPFSILSSFLTALLPIQITSSPSPTCPSMSSAHHPPPFFSHAWSMVWIRFLDRTFASSHPQGLNTMMY